MIFRVYATAENGDGHVQSLGDYEMIEDIVIRIGMFQPDIVITIETVQE